MTNKAEVSFVECIIMVVCFLLGVFVGESTPEYNRAMNAYADVWCQDQTYDYWVIDSCVRVENALTNCKIDIRHFSTGKYLANESKIECLGEPEPCMIEFNQCVEVKNPRDLLFFKKSQKFDVPV